MAKMILAVLFLALVFLFKKPLHQHEIYIKLHTPKESINLYNNNQVVMCIAFNLLFHERTKNDHHIIREKVQSKKIITSSVSSND